MKPRFVNYLFITVLSFSAAMLFMMVSVSESVATPEKTALNHLKVPQEIQDLLDKGIPVQDFAGMSEYVPRAIEGLLEGRAMVIIELEDLPLARHESVQRKQGLDMSMTARKDYIQALEQSQRTMAHELRSMDVSVFSNYTTVYNGFLARVPYKRLQDVRSMPGVRAVHPAPEHKPMLKASVPLIGATEVWEGVAGVDGEGVVIAIIDTGIDYTHKALGGKGDPDDYANIDPSQDAPMFFPNAKVIGGYDFAGTLYDAACTPDQESAGICTPNPNPDDNPLDEHGHGTHVAATAAGLAAGDLGPGVAPGAELMALKIFGKSGGPTHLTVDALEWAANHYKDHGYPHVINMSLGSNFGTGSDPSIVAANNAAELGMVVVASAGNAGDNHYITGSPASGSRVISVAATTTGYITGPTIIATGLEPMIYNPGGFDDNSGRFDSQIAAPLGYAGNLDGAADSELCTIQGLAGGALSGKVALIKRGGCTFSSKINNAHALGAVAALIFNNADGRFGMVGEPVNIPAGSLEGRDGIMLVEKDGQSVTINAQNDVTIIADPYTPVDNIGDFSSRGPRGTDSFLKPEVSAPGVSIFAADMASGTDGVSMSGTSMAAPHVSGLAALILEGKPVWTPEEIKALIINTSQDLALDVPISRSGSGRVSALLAMESDTVVMADNELVSLSWGVIMSRRDSMEVATEMIIHNKGHDQKIYNLAVEVHPESLTQGQTLTISPQQVIVDPGSDQKIPVTLTLGMADISNNFNNLEEYFGWITLTPDGGGDALRLPYYFQPKPVAGLNISTIRGIADPAVDQAEVRMRHNGPIASDIWLLPALNHNPSPDPSMGGPGDVKVFGLDYFFTHQDHGDVFLVGISTWGYWHVPQPFFTEFDLYIDADQNGTFDYVLFNYNLGWFQGAEHTNQWIVVLLDIAGQMLYLGSPFLIHSDYNASYMEWFVPAGWLTLGGYNSSFDYQLLSFDSGSQKMPKGSFDYKKPPLDWKLVGDAPGPGSASATAKIWVNDIAGYDYCNPLGAMLVDVMGDPRNSQGAQAYFVSLKPDRALSPGVLMLLLDE